MLMLQNVQFFNRKDKKYVFSCLLILLGVKKTLVTALRILTCNFRDEFSKETLVYYINYLRLGECNTLLCSHL